MLHRAEGRRRGFFERGRPNGMCTAKRDVVMYHGLCIRLRVSQWMWCAYRGCRTVNIVLLHPLHTGSTDTGNLSTHLRTLDEHTRGGTSAHCARLRHQVEVFSSDRASALSAARSRRPFAQTRLVCPVSGVVRHTTSSFMHPRQGKAMGNARHGHHTSHRYKHEPKRRERREREQRREQVS